MRKPSLTLLSSTGGTASGVFGQLKEIFNDMVDIHVVLFEDLPEPGSVSDRIVVITSKVIEAEAMNFIKAGTKTIVADRGVDINEVGKLYEIPDGSHVLLVNSIYETAMESIDQLKACGINNICFFPYYPGIGEWNKNCNYAITFGEIAMVPEGAFTIIDLNTRPFDITTCIKIAMEIGIYEKIKNTISSVFIRSSIELSHGYANQSRKNKEITMRLQQVLNLFKTGVVLLDDKNNISFYNTNAKKILKIKEKKSPYLKDLLGKIRTKEETFFYKAEGCNYHFEVIRNCVSSVGTILVISDIKKIEKIENDYRVSLVRNGFVAGYTFENIIYKSKKMKDLIQNAQQFAKSNSTIAIYGESGCGKELIAQSVHNASRRREEAFVAVNFAALSETLSESELFGYEEGAFTGAKRGGKKGLFELAHNGTIFLDEIGDAPLDIQKKILRVIQERKVMPIGGSCVIPVDIRIITATNRDLYTLVREKKFRADLYYRLNVLPIRVPALRERREDIVPLFLHFLNADFGIDIDAIPINARIKIEEYDWYGNIRELRNVAEYVANFMELNLDWQGQLSNVLKVAESDCLDGTRGNRFEEVYKTLEDNNDPLVYINVLRVMAQASGKETRKSLCEKLMEQNPHISESKIKRYLLILKSLDLIQSKTGGGTYIKEFGRDFLAFAEDKMDHKEK